jgi:ABC-type branched-subunit amino acid transport system substrate-binding protein
MSIFKFPQFFALFQRLLKFSITHFQPMSIRIFKASAFVAGIFFAAFLNALSRLNAQTSPASTEQSTIKIGISIVTTDPSGMTQLRGARMAVEEINAAGTVLGKKLELVPVYNEKRDYSKAQARINDLISEGAQCIITSGGSGMTLKAADVTIPKNVLLMTGSSSSPKITSLEDNDLVWRTVPSDVFQGRIAASLVESMKYKTAAVIHLDNAYGNELQKAFTESFQKRGGKVLISVKYADLQDYKTTEFKGLVELLVKQKPEVIYIVSYGEDGSKIANALAPYISDDYKPALMGCDANYNNDFLFGSRQSIIEGMTGLVYIHPKNDENYTKFAAAFKAYEIAGDAAELSASSLATLLGAESTNSYGATVYDAVYTIVYAMLKAKSPLPKDIAAHIRTIANTSTKAQAINVGEFAKAASILASGGNIHYNGASGSLDFDDKGDVTSGTYIIWKIKEGKFVEEGTISFP